MRRQKLHHFHNSLGLLRPNPLPEVLLRHRINFNPGLTNRININPILKLIRWINYMLKRPSITTDTHLFIIVLSFVLMHFC